MVKILENPNQITFNNTIPVTKFRVQLPQFRNNTIVNLTFWGNLACDVANYYKINDYILIEGYLSVKNSRKIEIAVFKIYPFLLSY
jgi:hypothetical protein